jgi:hypothetical protein
MCDPVFSGCYNPPCYRICYFAILDTTAPTTVVGAAQVSSATPS